MKKIVYPITLLVLVLVLSSAINSFKNTTLVLPPDTGELSLPDIPFEYEKEMPEHILNFVSGWGISDPQAFNSITNDGATLGRVLFYDVRLSADNSLSCANCHKQANSFSDDVALSIGIDEQLTTRNSMGLNDLAWQLGNSFFWDLRSSSLEDAVVQPILAAHELGKNMEVLIAKLEATEEYGSLFEAAYGTSDIDEVKVADALKQFIMSMTSFESKYDQHLAGDPGVLNASEMAGLNSFEENCSFCHAAPHFGSIDPFMFIPGNNGLDSEYTDLGMGGWMGDEFFNGVFKSPSLRNIEVTAPYMHDGRFESLEEVIDFYSEGVQHNENSSFNWMFGESFTGYDFSDGEKTDLLNFLRALTDQTLLTDEKWSNPWNTTVSSTDFVELAGVHVFPNPVADVVTVELTNPIGDRFDITLFDLQGRLVQSFQTNADILEIPRGNLAAGTYELKATDGKAQKIFKIIYQ